MADQLPTLRCPLKLAALMANPTVVSSAIAEADYMTKIARDRPSLVKCERDKCGFYSSYHLTEEVEDEGEEGAHEEVRVVEGCALALLPERMERIGEVADAGGELAEAAGTLSVLAAGAMKVAAAKMGLESELAEVVAGVETGTDSTDEETEAEE